VEESWPKIRELNREGSSTEWSTKRSNFFPRTLHHSTLTSFGRFCNYRRNEGGQLHLAATNRRTPAAHRKSWEGGEETSSEAQYQVPRTVIRNGYSGIVYSSGDWRASKCYLNASSARDFLNEIFAGSERTYVWTQHLKNNRIDAVSIEALIARKIRQSHSFKALPSPSIRH